MSQSMKGHQHTIGRSTEWITPRWILEPLGTFDLDPCTPADMPWRTATKMLTEVEDGLASSWSGRVWLNPPFDRRRIDLWLEKMAKHANGIALLPAATETAHFRRHVWDRASSVLFLRQRPHFCFLSGVAAKANSGCSICLVAFGRDNDEALRGSGLGTFCYGWRNA